MTLFKNILFVSDKADTSDGIIEQAVKFAEAHDAKLTILDVQPPLPSKIKQLEENYDQAISDDIRKKLEKHGDYKNSEITVMRDDKGYISIIKHILKNDYDAVIKMADDLEKNRKSGFRSMDMNLLRKCPVPIWLIRPGAQLTKPRIVVAVDPLSEAKEGRDLNTKLLKIGDDLTTTLDGHMEVLSCWTFEHENYLRNAPFARMTEDEIDVLIKEAQEEHQDSLSAALADYKPETLKGEPVCEKGEANDIIPRYVEDNNVAILVMGTVARTGIPGLVIGNTAENILQQLSCSLLAVKPDGFISPITLK